MKGLEEFGEELVVAGFLHDIGKMMFWREDFFPGAPFEKYDKEKSVPATKDYTYLWIRNHETSGAAMFDKQMTNPWKLEVVDKTSGEHLLFDIPALLRSWNFDDEAIERIRFCVKLHYDFGTLLGHFAVMSTAKFLKAVMDFAPGTVRNNRDLARFAKMSIAISFADLRGGVHISPTCGTSVASNLPKALMGVLCKDLPLPRMHRPEFKKSWSGGSQKRYKNLVQFEYGGKLGSQYWFEKNYITRKVGLQTIREVVTEACKHGLSGPGAAEQEASCLRKFL